MCSPSYSEYHHTLSHILCPNFCPLKLTYLDKRGQVTLYCILFSRIFIVWVLVLVMGQLKRLITKKTKQKKKDQFECNPTTNSYKWQGRKYCVYVVSVESTKPWHESSHCTGRSDENVHHEWKPESFMFHMGWGRNKEPNKSTCLVETALPTASENWLYKTQLNRACLYGQREWTSTHWWTSWSFCPLDGLRFFISGFSAVHFLFYFFAADHCTFCFVGGEGLFLVFLPWTWS